MGTRAALAVATAVVVLIFLPCPPSVRAATETVLYSFDGHSGDGTNPYARLTLFKNKLYGVTFSGGEHCVGYGPCGTVFSVDPKSGTESVVYSFCAQKNCDDGASPVGALINVKGTLYGTTEEGGGNTGCGGDSGCGTVFAVDPATGTETVIYAFCGFKNCIDGQRPFAKLLDVNGTLYGTANSGGGTGCDGSGCGVVFAIDLRKRAEAVLHAFQGNGIDGAWPYSGLSDVGGVLYGTTAGGGSRGGGSVYTIDPKSGTETTVYSFCEQGEYCADGESPWASLIDVNGILYGTTELGSTAYCKRPCGTVFQLDPVTGTESVLHYFGTNDGRYPQAALTEVNGVLYGTTQYGGRGGGGCWSTSPYGCGTVFSLDPDTGAETVVYNFCSKYECRDGALPMDKLIEVDGALYGTTYKGGERGLGAVFKIKL